MSPERSVRYRRELPVEGLARELHVPIDDVARLYGNELAKLEIGAHITAFLPIFAIRKVRDILRLRAKVR